MDYKYLKHMASRSASYIHPRGYSATRLLIKELSLETGMRVLEIGCGTGATIADIISSHDVTIYGVDAMDEMIRAANERIKFLQLSQKVNIIKSEAGKKFIFDSESFDRVYVESVIGFQDLQNLRLILAEAYRVLKSGGIFAATESLWKENVTDEEVKNIYRSSEKDFGLSQASSENININTMMSVCKQAGFEELKIINLDGDNIFKPGDNTRTVSSLYNSINKRKSFLKPRFIMDEISYRRKLKKHKNYGSFINSWMIKLKKS
jgi:ubiquinone/menaquinone biosynthesis C-methylase UbiE